MNWPCFWKPPGFSYKIGAALDTIPNLKAVDQQVINLQTTQRQSCLEQKGHSFIFCQVAMRLCQQTGYYSEIVSAGLCLVFSSIFIKT